MALIKCPECGKEISDKAKTCPNCGCPMDGAKIAPNITQSATTSQPKTKKKGKGCLIFFIIFIIVPSIIGVFANLITGEPITKTKESTASSTENEVADIALTKDEARDLDKQIWDYIYPVITAHNDLMAVMTSYSDGTVSELDFYNATKDFYTYTQDVWGAPPSTDDENGEAYLDSCLDYIIVEQTMADSLLTYLDTKQTSDLSKVQENIERCTQAVQIVASNRGTFLGIHDFTDEEIQEILNESFQ